MRAISLTTLIVLSGLFTALTVCNPNVMGANGFLLAFITHGFISVFIVIVTVSFVSVAQIHLEYTRIEREFEEKIFGEARREVNIGAGLLVVLLLASFPLVIIKAAFATNVTIQSALHSIALLFLVAAVFVMYDFVRTVYVIAEEEPIGGESASLIIGGTAATKRTATARRT